MTTAAPIQPDPLDDPSTVTRVVAAIRDAGFAVDVVPATEGRVRHVLRIEGVDIPFSVAPRRGHCPAQMTVFTYTHGTSEPYCQWKTFDVPKNRAVDITAILDALQASKAARKLTAAETTAKGDAASIREEFGLSVRDLGAVVRRSEDDPAISLAVEFRGSAEDVRKVLAFVRDETKLQRRSTR